MVLPVVTVLALAAGLLPAPAAAPPLGAWRWPLAGKPVVARPFQPPASRWGPGHRGVDLAAPPGAAVLAAGTGVVSFAGYLAGVGVVGVTHSGGLRTTYEPVEPSVHVGRAVSAGDQVGTLLPGHGNCGPARLCLHWGLLRGRTYLDPLVLVGRGPVRLLPLGPPAVALLPGLTTAGAVPAPLPARPDLDGSTAVRPAAVGAGAPTRPLRTPSAARTAIGSSAAGAAALGWWWRRRRRMAARLGRHRRAGPAAGAPQPRVRLSPSGRRAWP